MQPSEPPVRQDDQVDFVEATEFRPSQVHRPGLQRFFRPLPLLTALAFLLLTAFTLFLVTARSVEVRSVPQYEQIEISGGWLDIELGGRFLLRPGEYRLRLFRSGYYPLEETIEVGEPQNQEFDFEMTKLPGTLYVSSSPVSGARVQIDGEPIGETPTEGIELAAGEHTVTVTAERYQGFESELVIEGSEVVQRLEVELLPRWANVSLESDPAGAEVLIDGESVGSTPLTVEVLEGVHELQVSLDNHKSWMDELRVEARQDRKLGPIRLERADGLVSVHSTPAGASVTVNGAYRGQTPLQLELPPGHSYGVTVTKAGYKAAKRQITVKSGAESSLSLKLEPFHGEVRIYTDPRDVEVYVNGRLAGSSGKSYTLPAVPQSIELKKTGYAPYRTTITPQPGFAQEIAVRLKTTAQAKRDATPRRIRTAIGQELILVEPGRFTMGSSRRDQGRRSNESLRQIELTRRFYIGILEVTNGEFRAFDARHRSGSYQGVNLDQDKQPAVNVDWDQVARFCNWLSAREGLAPAYVEKDGRMTLADPVTSGYRLPTEAEWVWAARYAAGASTDKFPWGGSLPPGANSGNFADMSAKSLFPVTLPDYNDGFASSAPVGSFPPSPLGLFDAGGNVAEWVHDFYTTYPGQAAQLTHDPWGPKVGKFHVVRGSSWQHSTVTELRLAYRDYSDSARPDLGFRLARYVE